MIFCLLSAELGAAVQGGVTSMVDMMEAPPLPGSNIADAERRRSVPALTLLLTLRPTPCTLHPAL